MYAKKGIPFFEIGLIHNRHIKRNNLLYRYEIRENPNEFFIDIENAKDIPKEELGGSIGASILFQSSEFYYYNPGGHTLEMGAKFPEVSSGGTLFHSAAIGNSQYFITTSNKNLYKLEGESWSIESELPININRSPRSILHSIGNDLYVLNSSFAYRYNILTKSWVSLNLIITHFQKPSIDGVSLGDRAFLITLNGRIWEFVASDNRWENIANFPGRKGGEVVTFAFNDKIYIGFNHAYSSPINWLENRLWAYDLRLDTWEQQQRIPLKLDLKFLFNFSIGEKLYLGHGKDNIFDLWEFDATIDP